MIATYFKRRVALIMSSVMNGEGITRSLWLVSFVNAWSGGYVDVCWWSSCFLHDKMVKVGTMIDMWISYTPESEHIHRTCDWLVWDWAWQGTKSKNLRCRLLGPAPGVPAATAHQAWAARSKHPTHKPWTLRTSTPDIEECSWQVFKATWVPDTSKHLITKRPLFRWTCATAG